ncbi:MAG TPA: hypothetical protein V6D43_11265 [Candidatus Sericytochromatia bacterium]|jgi:hypothetical protein
MVLLQQQRVRSQPPAVQSQGLALAPTHEGVKLIMTKKQCLKPWAIARQLPNLKWSIIARYRSRSDADGHLLLLRQRVSNLEFKIVFDLLDCK